ncbi:MAG: sigma-54 dependent transcriptional regulator/response regulator, partial [Acidobacteria bacterium]|jgi:DNA-binding NtrC family response regulator|nr:sigma-54 dependent transcriptional regulator/response regulator [Acidobacteriota bacterium]
MGNRILVVDDEAVVLESVRKALKGMDCLIDTAADAAEAQTLLRRTEYDLIITDLMMPHMDGLQLLERLRELQVPARIILLTGYPTLETAAQAKRRGAFDLVTKPFTSQELASVVAEALEADPRPGE